MGLFSDERINLAVWDKGAKILGSDPGIWRCDAYGNIMKYSEFGNRSSEFGWEKDHVIALARGGPDTIDNMRPLHWHVNARLGGLFGSL